MIRRNFPLSKDDEHWLLISQQEHARISHQLAAAWDPALLFAGEVRERVYADLLAGILHHDDGWAEWWSSPQMDRAQGRPYGFTEMPVAAAQRLWSLSVDACAEIGPLPGCVVASHFIALQSDQDADFELWQPWLEKQEFQRFERLQQWKKESPQNTDALAERCVYLLQTFDWLSLWICCRCPVSAEEVTSAEPLTLGGSEHSFGPLKFTPAATAERETACPVVVEPWPFTTGSIEIAAEALRVEAARYDTWQQVRNASERVTLRWNLVATA